MSNETTIKSIVNENISMKIFLSNMEQKHEHEKEATVDEIVKKQSLKIAIASCICICTETYCYFILFMVPKGPTVYCYYYCCFNDQ